MDQDHTVAVEVHGEAVAGGAIAERDGDPQHQLTDLDIAVAVAIALGVVGDRSRHAQRRRSIASLAADNRVNEDVERSGGTVQCWHAVDMGRRPTVLREDSDETLVLAVLWA